MVCSIRRISWSKAGDPADKRMRRMWQGRLSLGRTLNRNLFCWLADGMSPVCNRHQTGQTGCYNRLRGPGQEEGHSYEIKTIETSLDWKWLIKKIRSWLFQFKPTKYIIPYCLSWVSFDANCDNLLLNQDNILTSFVILIICPTDNLSICMEKTNVDNLNLL